MAQELTRAAREQVFRGQRDFFLCGARQMAHQHYHKRITESCVWKMELDELRRFRLRGTVLFTAAWSEGTHPKADLCQTPSGCSAFHRHTLVLSPN